MTSCDSPLVTLLLEKGATPEELPVCVEVGFTEGCRNALLNANLNTLGEIAACDRLELLNLKNFGHVRLDETVRILHAHGLALRGGTPQLTAAEHQVVENARALSSPGMDKLLAIIDRLTGGGEPTKRPDPAGAVEEL